MRWLDRILRRPHPDEVRELEREQHKTRQDWQRVRETSRNLADLIEEALKGDEGGAHRHTR
jgi:hypothetical protein